MPPRTRQQSRHVRGLFFAGDLVPDGSAMDAMSNESAGRRPKERREEQMITTGPITPHGGLVASDDDIVEAWVYAADEVPLHWRAQNGWLDNKIVVAVSHGGLGDQHPPYHFRLYREQAIELADRLRELAETNLVELAVKMLEADDD
jgi:hypothetical protein